MIKNFENQEAQHLQIQNLKCNKKNTAENIQQM